MEMEMEMEKGREGVKGWKGRLGERLVRGYCLEKGDDGRGRAM